MGGSEVGDFGKDKGSQMYKEFGAKKATKETYSLPFPHDWCHEWLASNTHISFLLDFCLTESKHKGLRVLQVHCRLSFCIASATFLKSHPSSFLIFPFVLLEHKLEKFHIENLEGIFP